MNTISMTSPLGTLRLFARADELVGVYLPEMEGGGPAPPRGTDQLAPAAESRACAVLALAAAQLAEYFAGARRVFELPLGPRGTGFQERVWHALRAIPYGETRSYGELARAIGRPAASRAVGAANAKNPISIIVPCHRVIAANGELTGYAGGMAAKRWLLDHERHAGGLRLLA